MIRILESKTTDTVGKYWYYLTCDKGDTKPTGEFPADSGKTIANGSRLFETGTEMRYEYSDGVWNMIGTGLPEVTTEDDGDVLTVVDGQWAKAAPSGGSTIRIITTTNSGNTITFDNETQASIYNAVASGEIIIIKAYAPTSTSSNATGLYICSAYSGYEANFTSISRMYSGVTDINTFTVSKNSTANTTRVYYYATEDYHSGGPI